MFSVRKRQLMAIETTQEKFVLNNQKKDMHNIKLMEKEKILKEKFRKKYHQNIMIGRSGSTGAIVPLNES